VQSSIDIDAHGHHGHNGHGKRQREWQREPQWERQREWVVTSLLLDA
jgi:hypothetical protein